MQNVSQAYKDAMNLPVRNRGYIRVILGIVNVAAQANAQISGSQDIYSDTSMVFKDGTQTITYANYEENYTEIGNNNILFRPTDRYEWLEKCFITAEYGSSGNADAVVSFDHAVTFDNVIFNFGSHYPVDFDLIDNNGGTYEVRGNDQEIVNIENQFTEVSSFTLHVINMIYPDNKLRIYSVSFGRGFLYENDIVKDSSMEYSMSPINETLPQINFALTLINENHRFDMDNDNSDLSLLDTSSEMDIYYGYEIGDDIEWIHGAKLYCSVWGADRDNATIEARDILQNNNKQYYLGSASQITLYNLAVQILTEMGIENYTIDDELKTISTKNPLPIIDCREALQIVANAAGKKLLLTRNGGVKIGDSFTYTLSSNGDYYGKIETIRSNDSVKPIYAIWENELIEIGNTNIYFPYSPYLDVGYVSYNKSLSTGYFNALQADISVPEEPLNNNLAVLEHTLSAAETSVPNPELTITLSDLVNIGSISLLFGAQTCEEFIVESYAADELLETVNITGNHDKTVTVNFTKTVMNKIIITFIKTEKPETRIYINYLELNPNLDSFQLTQNDMLTTPLFSKLETIKEIVVPYFAYQLDTTEQKLSETNFSVTNVNEEFIVYMTEPCSDYRLSVSSGTVTITEYDCHYVQFQFSTIGDKTLIIYGKKYNQIVQTYTKTLNENGNIVRWENPLINTEVMAQNLAEYLAEYYDAKGTYEYDIRGNPELDVNDTILQEHWDGRKLKVLVTDMKLDFDGAFSGNVKVLRLKEEG